MFSVKLDIDGELPDDKEERGVIAGNAIIDFVISSKIQMPVEDLYTQYHLMLMAYYILNAEKDGTLVRDGELKEALDEFLHTDDAMVIYKSLADAEVIKL